jgi:hypothetical protein
VNIALPNPAGGTQRQEHRERAGQPREAGRDRDDEQAGGEDGPLAEPLDEGAAAERRHEPEEGERADGQPDGRRADAERTGEERDGRRDDAEAERDDEGDDRQDVDLPGEVPAPEQPHEARSWHVAGDAQSRDTPSR